MCTAFRAWIAASAALMTGSACCAQWCDWEPMGEGFDGGWSGSSVSSLEVFDDGVGPALYAAGSFGTKIERWDGEEWIWLSPGLQHGLVFDLEVFDDGSGPALYAGGSFESSDGAPVRGIAKWDGSAWSEVGGGIRSGPEKAAVYTMEVYDGGSGPALYAAGKFTEAGGAAMNYIARWDGKTWTGVGGGFTSYVYSLAVFDDGSGPALYAGGLFRTAGGLPISYFAKWDGESWSEAGPVDDRVGGLTVLDDGRGPALYVTGRFESVAGLPIAQVARWDGRTWSEIPGAPPGALGVFDDGRGPALYVGGEFRMVGGIPVNSIARWDGLSWSSPGAGVGGETIPGVYTLTAFDDGSGPGLIVGGSFSLAGSVRANHIARWRCEPCFADCDADRALTFFDFLCFQNHFAATTPYADCDDSGAHDFFDFLCFQNAFAAGCS